MSVSRTSSYSLSNIFSLIKQSLNGEPLDYTQGSIRRAVILLAIPMMLEMSMESVFALVDIYFVSHLGKHAVSTVGLTESVITIIYSLAIGISMAATAMVARRVGEKILKLQPKQVCSLSWYHWCLHYYLASRDLFMLLIFCV